MAFTEKSYVGSTSDGNGVVVVPGSASYRIMFRSLVIYNIDTVSHYVYFRAYVSSVAYILYRIQVAAGESIIFDVPIVLPVGSGNSLQIYMGETATTTQPTFFASYAEVS